MKTKIIIFEDYYVKNFYPLTLTRAVYDIKIGTLSNTQRFQKLYAAYDIGFYARAYLRDVFYEKYAMEINEDLYNSDYDYYLFINGRIITDQPIEISEQEVIGVQNATVSYFRIKKSNLPKNFDPLSKDFMEQLPKNINRVQTDFYEIKHIWDPIKYNKDFILRDFNNFYGNNINSSLNDTIKIIKDNFVYIDKNVKIGDFVVIDATNGPVIIKSESIIEPYSYIKGPVFIGNNNLIKSHSQIREGSSIHYQCKVGGEVSNSIFHSFSNKAHHGFIGDSYIGKWVNIGAGTTTSNLKNNYSYINLENVYGDKIKTDMQFLGSIIGDYSKLSINCSLNSGTVIGVSANVYNSGELLPKFIKCFSWGITEKYKLEKAIEDAQKMMARRNVTLTPYQEQLLKYVYEHFS